MTSTTHARDLGRTALLVVAITALVAGFAPIPATASDDVNQVVDITFPVHDPDGLTTYSDDYLSRRSRGDHGATDIGGQRAYGVPVHAAVGGRVTWITGLDGSLPNYGWMISIAGDDGREYNYVHLGRQDGPASEAYAPGIGKGSVVERGQHIGYLGHSGNASAEWPHLHFEIEDDAVVDRQGTNRINPYYSLRDAERRGDLPGRVERAPRAPGDGFDDVAAGHTHAEGIDFVDLKGVTSGCDAFLYCPDRGVTRGQMATFLQKAMGLPVEGEHGFDDVPEGHPHEAGIRAVVAAGIAQGTGERSFAPDQTVRREQMAMFLRNALDLEDVESDFPDVPEDSVHAGAIGAVAQARIAAGNAEGNFVPVAPVTRAQMATFLMRAADAR
ncbi:MAG: S-layer homology domain-containing protein [Nitriliruptor sp.]